MAYVRTPLGRWYFQERGSTLSESDPAIVLLHGLLFDGGMWNAQVPPLASLGRVIVFDGPGHGHSEVPPPFSLEQHADAVVDALSQLRVKRAIFCGLSWGAMTAMRLALQHPDRVSALALLNTRATSEDAAKILRYRAFLLLVQRYGLPMWLSEKRIAPILFSEAAMRRNPDLVALFTRTVNGYPREGVARATEAVEFHRTNVLNKLVNIHAPTLVVGARHDRGTPPEHSEAIAKKIPNSRLVTLDCGHTSTLEVPESVNAVLVPFVREVLDERR